MYIRGLNPRNSTELVEAVPIVEGGCMIDFDVQNTTKVTDHHNDLRIKGQCQNGLKLPYGS